MKDFFMALFMFLVVCTLVALGLPVFIYFAQGWWAYWVVPS